MGKAAGIDLISGTNADILISESILQKHIIDREHCVYFYLKTYLCFHRICSLGLSHKHKTSAGVLYNCAFLAEFGTFEGKTT